MPKAQISLFFDSSALVAGAISSQGASRALLILAGAGYIDLLVTEQVIVETERALARKAPKALPAYREMILSTSAQILPDPPLSEVLMHQGIISHPVDVPIVVAAMRAKVDFLVTLNRRHFIDDPDVANQSGLRIGTPDDALEWVRAQLSY